MRRRNAARWRIEGQGIFGCRNFQPVEAAKARSRQAGCRPVPMERRCPAWPNQLTNLAEDRSRNRRAAWRRSSDFIRPLDGTGTGASAGRHSETASRWTRERRQASSAPSGAHTPVRVGSAARPAPFPCERVSARGCHGPLSGFSAGARQARRKPVSRNDSPQDRRVGSCR